MKSILDPSFKYVSSASTDVAATFRRIRREMKAAPPAKPVPLPGSRAVVALMPRNKRKA